MSTEPTVVRLSCNRLAEPLGVETPVPRLSWQLAGERRGLRQSAWQVRVAAAPDQLATAPLWDSGQVAGGACLDVPYGGPPLVSRQRCWWQVRLWDDHGDALPWSAVACWEMGLLDAADWGDARWIANVRLNPMGDTTRPAPLLRRDLHIDGDLAAARLYISGLGYYEAYLNGERVGDEVLAPAFTRYDRAACYQVHDVTSLLRPGANVIGAILGNGWYNCSTAEVWNFQQAPWRDGPKLLCQLHLIWRDGREETIVSDSSWRTATGPIVFDALRNGETYDARLERPGWATAAVDAADWQRAVVVPGPGGVLRSQQHTPIRVTGTLRPVAVKQVKSGVWVYDLGQNISGWARLMIRGEAGTEIILRYAEKRGADGDIDQGNINSFIKSGDCQTDRYILKGGGLEIWEPRFTYHGFQYVQVTGLPGKASLDLLEGRVVHTDFANHGEFECANPLLNRIQTAARWSTLGNYHGIPTDCPHREKNGWTGDASLSAEQVLLNFDPVTAYRKWMADFRDIQRPSGQLPGIVPTGGWGFNWGSGPAWDSAAILIPWYMYVYAGDRVVLAEQYPLMCRFLDYAASMADGHIVDFGLGDWCPPEGGAGGHACPSVVTDTAYYYVDAVVVAETAAVLGRHADAARYRELAAAIRQAWRARFLEPATGKVTGDCQTSMGCALYQGLVDDGERPAVLAALVAAVEAKDRHIDCGILGAKYVMHALNDHGRADLAYAMGSQSTYPSWGHWIAQGATTLWETWKGDSSRNHHMFSDISAWFYRGLAGINPDPRGPGFARIVIRPNPVPGLAWVRCHHDSPYGRIVANWQVGDGQFAMELVLPPSTTASVALPASSADGATEGGKPLAQVAGIEVIGYRDGRLLLEVAAGSYTFRNAFNNLNGATR